MITVFKNSSIFRDDRFLAGRALLAAFMASAVGGFAENVRAESISNPVGGKVVEGSPVKNESDPVSLDGWKAETFTLPPGFAPELPTGHESLRFAPGWREPKAEDFWSYAFVMWINEPAPDKARIKTLLEKYYNGLLASFAAGKNKDISKTPARVEVVSTAPNYFELKMHVIDAFATFEPIELRVVVSSHAETDKRTVLRFQVSPQPKEHAIWRSLEVAIASIVSQDAALPPAPSNAVATPKNELKGDASVNAPHAAIALEPANRDPYFTPTESKSTSYMPKVIIRNIREDRAGNIWFATFGGPIRYDGKEFTNFSEEVGLAKTRIFSLLVDRSGALWFGSITGGASRYDGKSFTKFTEKEGLGNNNVSWIFEDRDGNIWLGTDNGASRYDGKSMTNFTTKEGLVHDSVYTIGQDASGRIWFGTQGGICSYDGKTFSNLADQVGRSFVNIRAMAVDRSGNVWFGGQEGAFRYDGKSVSTFTSKDGLLDDFVGSMIVDRAGNIWLGHPGGFPAGQGGGASRYDGKSFVHFTQREGLGSKTVYAMLEDKAGNIWFGSVDAGASRYDGKNFTNFSATAPPSLPAQGNSK